MKVYLPDSRIIIRSSKKFKDLITEVVKCPFSWDIRLFCSKCSSLEEDPLRYSWLNILLSKAIGELHHYIVQHASTLKRILLMTYGIVVK